MEPVGKQINILVRQFNLYLNHDLAHLGVSATEILYLASLFHEDGLTQDALAAEHVVDKAAVARTVANMEAKGLVSREANPANRRQKKLYLTDKARDMQPALREAQERWLHVMTEDEDDRLTDELTAFLDRAVQRAIAANRSKEE